MQNYTSLQEPKNISGRQESLSIIEYQEKNFHGSITLHSIISPFLHLFTECTLWPICLCDVQSILFSNFPTENYEYHSADRNQSC